MNSPQPLTIQMNSPQPLTESNMDSEPLIANKMKELAENYNDMQLKDILFENGLGNVPLTAHTHNLLLKKLARKLLNITTSDDDVMAVQYPLSAPEESNNNTDTLRKNLEEARESLSNLLNDDYKTHYAVCVPGLDDSIRVLTDFREVLKVMKEFKANNPRMLSFPNKAEAIAFAERATAHDICEGMTIKTSYPEERAEVEVGEGKLFPSLTTPQINEFRIQLEKGNIAFCRERILSNPRFLIGNGDMPTILKEGPRYNAMHTSVIAGQLESCRLVMEMVNNVDFLKRMYLTQKRSEENSERLIDLYLNTPDKAANKTPLHFASERGLLDIVAFLVTFQACIRNFNKHILSSLKKDDKTYELRAATGKSPEEITCSRYNGPNPATVKAKIVHLIKEGVCYVPLIKSDVMGPCVQVGDPFLPSSPYKLVSEIEEVFRPSPQAEICLKDIRNTKVWAFAGPMSTREGWEFKRAWKSPRMKRTDLRKTVLIPDGDRGFEHYGRELADNHATSWQEFWPFLNQFTDLRSESGLDLLELFYHKLSLVMTLQTFYSPPVLFVVSGSYKVSNNFIRNPSLDLNTSLEEESFESADSANAESTTAESNTADSSLPEESMEEEPPSSKVVADVLNKSSHGFLSSVWGTFIKIKTAIFSTNASRSKPPPISQLKQWGEETKNGGGSDPPREPHQNIPTADQGDEGDDLVACQKELPLVAAEEKSLSQVSSHTACDDEVPVWTYFTEQTDSEIPEAFASRSYKDNAITPRHWKYRSSRYSADSPDKPYDRDSESPSRRYSSKKSRMGSDRDGDSPVRRVSRLAKHSTNSQSDLSRSSLSNKNSSNFNAKIDSLCGKLDTPYSATPEKHSTNSQSDYSHWSMSNKSSGSFNTKVDSLCRRLDTLCLITPETSQSTSFTSCDMPSGPNSQEDEPSLFLFTGKMYTKFTAHLNTLQGFLKHPGHLLPIACLRQEQDCVLADIFLSAAMPNSNWLHPILDEQTQQDVMKNVWVNFLVVFPDSDRARKYCSLPSDAVLNVAVEGLPEDNKPDFKSLQEMYKESKDSLKPSLSVPCKMRVVRRDTMPKKDFFICGSIATNVDAEVYCTLNKQSHQLIQSQSQRFPHCRQWLENMEKRGQEVIRSLPTPSRVLRQERSQQIESPLVLNDARLHPHLTSTPLSSKS